MEVFKWSLELTKFYVTAWQWLNEPFVKIGGVEINFLGFFTSSVIIAIIVARLVELAIPT